MLRKRSFVCRSLLQKVNACPEGIKRKMCVFLWQSAPSIKHWNPLGSTIVSYYLHEYKVWYDNDGFIAPNRLHCSTERLHSEIPVFPRKDTPERPHHARANTHRRHKNMTSTCDNSGKKIVLKKVKYNGLRLCECRSRCISQGLLHEAQVLVSK